MIAELPSELQGAGIAVVALAAFKAITAAIEALKRNTEQCGQNGAGPLCREHAERIARTESEVKAARSDVVEIKDDVRHMMRKIDRVLYCVNGGRNDTQG